MTAVAAIEFKARLSRRNIKLIVGDENIVSFYSVIMCHGADGASETLTIANVSAGDDVAIVVDGADASAGTYTLALEVR